MCVSWFGGGGKRRDGDLSVELLRGVLCVAVNFNEFAWLPTFNDAAPRDSLLFTCCSSSFYSSTRYDARRDHCFLLRTIEAICRCYEQRTG